MNAPQCFTASSSALAVVAVGFAVPVSRLLAVSVRVVIQYDDGVLVRL